MKSFKTVWMLSLFFTCLCQGTLDNNIDFYWREFSGIVPRDAIPGGLDINNKTTYIGQGYVKENGIIVGMIYPNKNSLEVPMSGVKTVNTYMKILCSSQPGAFKWITATSQNFHLVMINKYPVRGGYENSYTLNIGRISFQGELVIGKIVTASPDSPGEAPMYFVSNNKEHRINSYEALIYDPEAIFNKIDVRAQKKL